MDTINRLYEQLNLLDQKPIMYAGLGMLAGLYGPRIGPNLPENIFLPSAASDLFFFGMKLNTIPKRKNNPFNIIVGISRKPRFFVIFARRLNKLY